MNNNSIIITIIIIVLFVGVVFYMYHHTSHIVELPLEGAITLTGTVTCLPHMNKSQPQTLECAYGLYDQQHGYYYAIENTASSTPITQFPTGSIITVTGTFVPTSGTTYDTIGNIRVATIAPESNTAINTNATNNTNRAETTSDGIITFTTAPDFALAVTPEQILNPPVIPPCDTGFDYCLYYKGQNYAHTNFLSAGISIQKIPTAEDQSTCLTVPPAGYESLKPIASSSQNTYAMSLFAPIGNGAAGSYSKDEAYRLFTSGSCYQFLLRIGVAQIQSTSTSSTTAFTTQDETNFMGELRSFLSQFTLNATGETMMLPAQS